MKTPLTSISLSSDGSILAVGAAAIDHNPPVVTLWEVKRNVLVKVFCCMYDRSDIKLAHTKKTKTKDKDKDRTRNTNENQKHGSLMRSISWLSFLDNSSCPVIAVQVDNGDGSKTFGMHSIFNPGIPQWTKTFSDCYAVTSSIARSMVVIAQIDTDSARLDQLLSSSSSLSSCSSKITVIDATSSMATSCIVDSWKLYHKCVSAMTVVESIDMDNSTIVVMARDRSFVKLKLDEGGRLSSTVIDKKAIQGVASNGSDKSGIQYSKLANRSAFADIYGNTIQDAVENGQSSDTFALSSPYLPAGVQPWTSLLDAPAHVLPPMTDLCSPFLDKLMGL